ncbi:UNVERIFIED_CONTAM: hypothetical protein HDU68_005953 [Siphonaria sp. JEL0065]|nr:hypothetical protein HDU68_005953 [Siphonaria sp. JEL0065]
MLREIVHLHNTLLANTNTKTPRFLSDFSSKLSSFLFQHNAAAIESRLRLKNPTTFLLRALQNVPELDLKTGECVVVDAQMEDANGKDWDLAAIGSDAVGLLDVAFDKAIAVKEDLDQVRVALWTLNMDALDLPSNPSSIGCKILAPLLLSLQLGSIRLIWIACIHAIQSLSQTNKNPIVIPQNLLDVLDRIKDHLVIIGENPVNLPYLDAKVLASKSNAIATDVSIELPDTLQDMKRINQTFLTLCHVSNSCIQGNPNDSAIDDDQVHQSIMDLATVLIEQQDTLHGCWVLGNLKYQNATYKAAKEIYESALKHSYTTRMPPAYYLNQIGCALAHLVKFKEYDIALLYFQSALEIDPEYIEAMVGYCWILRVLNYTEMERKLLTRLVKKIISNLQTLPPIPFPHHLNPLQKITRLASLINPKEASTMLSIIYPYIQRCNSPPSPQSDPCSSTTDPSTTMLTTIQRLQSLTLTDTHSRRKARAMARVLLDKDPWDFVAGVVVGRCAVFGKRVLFSSAAVVESGTKGEGDDDVMELDHGGEKENGMSSIVETEWGVEGEETNLGEEGFSVSEAEEVVEKYCLGVLRMFYDRLVKKRKSRGNDGDGQATVDCIPADIALRLETDESLNWILNDEIKTRDLLVECFTNLSIIKWMLAKYTSATTLASNAYNLDPTNLSIAHNYSLMLYRLGDLKQSVKVWMNARIPCLAEISAIVQLKKEFWIVVGKEMVCGSDLVTAFERAVELEGGVVVKGMWNGRRRKEKEGDGGREKADGRVHRWLDMTSVRFLCCE